jgi:hypothetical protein
METMVYVKVGGMILLAVLALILIIKNQRFRIPLQIVLVASIVLLGYWIFESIMQPIRFNREMASRNEVVIQQLKDIRTAQLAYQSVNGRFVSTFDSLFNFIENGKLPMVLKVGEVDTMTEAEALRRKLIIRDTTYVPVLDTLFKDKPAGFDYRSLRFVPFTDNKDTMVMDAGLIERSTIKVPVFVCSVEYVKYLNGLDKQLVKNLVATKEQLEKFPGLMVGSMVESTRDGNWE